MKNHFFIAVTAAMALASCTSEDLVVGNDSAAAGSNIPVAFDSYLARSTRANTVLTDNDGDGTKFKGIRKFGFGVYGYEQGTDYIEDYTNRTIVPNFFLNEKVAIPDGGTAWAYSKDLDPSANSGVKYWPNNEGAMLSFYAYAAYDPTLDPQPTSAPCRLIYNGVYNGPAIQYTMPEDLTRAVDLCWGEDKANPGKAPVNKTKPSIMDKVSFNFKHAMARYGFNVQVWSDAITDNPNHDDPSYTTNQSIKEGTTIKIKSVKLAGNFATTGVLRLYDGQWDAQTALTGEYELKSNFGKTVQAGLDGTEAVSEIPLLGDATSDNDNLYVMMIPNARFQIVVEYDVETLDDKLGGTVVTHNKITSPGVYEAKPGVATAFHLNLGMTTVKFDAEVTGWDETSDPSQEVDLPGNYTAAVAAAGYHYSDFTPTGTTTVSGNTVTTTYSTTPTGADVMNDLARFLGAMYRAGGVQQIVFDGKTYKWDAAMNLKGSNYRETGHTAWGTSAATGSLVSAITAWSGANPTATQFTFKCDGVDMIYKVQQ